MRGSKVIDLRPITTSDGLSQTTINIIEQNTGTQIDHKILYTEIDWIDGVPSEIRKYENSTKATMLYLITPTFVDGLPTSVVSNNLDENIVTTTTISWTNGVPTVITKVEAS